MFQFMSRKQEEIIIFINICRSIFADGLDYFINVNLIDAIALSEPLALAK